MVDVLETLLKLPKMCMATDLSNPNATILMKRGVMGYYPFRQFNNTVDAEDYVLLYNQRHCITKAQIEAMRAGSMFGWHVPAADPDTYDADGKSLPAPKGWDKVKGGARAHD